MGGQVLQVSVETPIVGVRLVRIAGRLDRAAAASVLRLISAQLELIAARHCDVTDMIVDIGAVHSFEPGGLDSLRQAPDIAGRHGVRVCLSGCGGRVHLLPVRARTMLDEFRRFPTAEVAVAQVRAVAGVGSSSGDGVGRTAFDAPAGPAAPPALPLHRRHPLTHQDRDDQQMQRSSRVPDPRRPRDEGDGLDPQQPSTPCTGAVATCVST